MLPVEIPGATTPDTRGVNNHQVNRGYLDATGIQLRTGRWFDEADVSARRFYALVNQTFAARYFPVQSPLGKAITIPRFKAPPANLATVQFEIIGTTEDAMHELHNGEANPEVYIPYTHTALADTLVIHTAGDPARMAPYVRAQIYQIDSAQFVDETRTLESLLDRYVYSRGRFYLWLMGVFAALGLALSVIGVYGLLSHLVAIQQRDIGVRMAIGAGSNDIVRLILGRGARLIGAGLVTGISVTLILLRRFGLQLGVSDPFHPASLAGAAAVLAAAAVIACLIPALRAGRTNPVDALRLE